MRFDTNWHDERSSIPEGRGESMGYLILHYYADLMSFALLGLCAAWLMGRWIRRSTRQQGEAGGAHGMSLGAWAVILAVLLTTILLALEVGSRESERLKEIVSGFAPTYAGELSRMGHAKISVNTPADDPTYLAMIQAQIRWEKENPWIADIYTFGRRPDGKTVLLVDSETDYNHSGGFEGEREQRTPIGEVYEEDQELLARAFAGQDVFTDTPTSDRWGEWMSTYVPMRDDAGNVTAVLGVDYPAGAWIQSILWHRAAILVLGSLVLAVLLGGLGTTTVLRSEIQRRQQSEEARAEMQKRLLVASRRAGMAEIATDVLHNVGNVLNSVNISANVITDKLRQTDLGGLTDVAQALRRHDADMQQFLATDALGKQLPDFLSALAEAINDEHKALRQEVDRLSNGIDHIKAIVRTQQELAKDSTVHTPEYPGKLVAEVLEMQGPSLQEHGVQVVCEVEEFGPVLLDKHKVLQILMNLVSNADHSMEDMDKSKRKIIIRARRVAKAKGQALDAIVFEVEDAGIGIPAENLSKIFQHGFTTRAEGHGFGLHSAANAASEMGGTLRALSGGPGSGARFILQLQALEASTECTS